MRPPDRAAILGGFIERRKKLDMSCGECPASRAIANSHALEQAAFADGGAPDGRVDAETATFVLWPGSWPRSNR